MLQNEDFQDAPPSYSEATGSTTTSTHLSPNSAAQADPRHRRSRSRNGIPSAARRSMEDEQRPLPEGWVRQYDSISSHQFFVDTRADPPRSIWHHPYDDEEYLGTLSPEQRRKIISIQRPLTPDPDAHTTDEDSPVSPIVDEKGKKKQPKSTPMDRDSEAEASSSATTTATAAQAQQGQNQEKLSLGRRWKDKLTGTTHEEREAKRQERAEREQRAYEMHAQIRGAMQRAAETGQPQHIGKDKDGRDLYIEPPAGYPGAYGYGANPPPNSRAYSPYRNGPYSNPNARFLRPANPYTRRPGYGYGGGLGGPGIGVGLGAGLLGGLLLGDALGGF